MSPAVLGLLAAAAPAFQFENVQPWRFSEGRQENIPALSATLVNLSGDDWADARFRVSVQCAAGGERHYTVLLHDILLGSQSVRATAFDAIGEVQPCPGSASIEFLDGRPYDESRRPAFVLFGFSYQPDGQPLSTDLAGILDYRRHSDHEQETHPHLIENHGRRFQLPDFPNTAFYLLRLEPGQFGFAGFLLPTPSGQPRNPLSRFLRTYNLKAGTISYLGIFRLEQPSPHLHSAVYEPAPEVLRQFTPPEPRPLMRATTTDLSTASSITADR
ncbi:MAG: hypothetical protein HY821_25375 [Acidobacteria bacterium]|nr:hypothetical protein [Acidobacteriota bacterium]